MKNRKRGLKFPFLLGFLLNIAIAAIILTPPAFARGAYISDVVVTNNRDYLLLYFGVKDCFTIEMDRAIGSGIDTTFTFFVKLYEKRDYWWDKKIADVQVRHNVKYDALKRIYELRLSEQNNEKITVKDFDAVRKIMAEIVALKVTPIHNLSKGGHYKLQMMAELDKIRLPLYLHHIFFFLSLWDFDTKWHAYDFRY